MSKDISEKFGLNYLIDKKGIVPPDGLTLRDVFAAFALAGILNEGNPYALGVKWCAAAAYDMADAMLAQREQASKP